MTSSGFVRDLLRDQWGETSEFDPVEQPRIVQEGTVERRSVHTKDNDVIFCQDGGLPTVQPQSIGYREQYVEVTIDAEIITAVGRDRLVGPPNETFAGLEGEVRRILEKFRKGVPSNDSSIGVENPGYDIIQLNNFDDQIGEIGADLFKGTWSFTFITFAQQISQPAIK